MIRFRTIQGDVIVLDLKNGYCEMARSGMELPESGKYEYVIVTTRTSSAQVEAADRTISIGQSKALLVAHNRIREASHNVEGSRGGIRLFLGRVWSRIHQALGGNDHWDEGGGGGGGIRG